MRMIVRRTFRPAPGTAGHGECSEHPLPDTVRLGLLVQGLLLVLLLRGPFRKFIIFTFYVLGAFAADVSEWIAYYRLGWQSPAYRRLYWMDHVTVNLLLFLVVIVFTYAALDGNPRRLKAAKALGVIVAVTVALPFAMLHNHHNKTYELFTSQWFNHANQIWNFGAAIMDLVLWAALLLNRRRDPQLVGLSIGVGIATASAAIAWGVRQWLSEAHRWPVDSLMVAINLTCLLLWCWVFRPWGGASLPRAEPLCRILGDDSSGGPNQDRTVRISIEYITQRLRRRRNRPIILSPRQCADRCSGRRNIGKQERTRWARQPVQDLGG
jgi:hypothetical protein